MTVPPPPPPNDYSKTLLQQDWNQNMNKRAGSETLVEGLPQHAQCITLTI